MVTAIPCPFQWTLESPDYVSMLFTIYVLLLVVDNLMLHVPTDSSVSVKFIGYQFQVFGIYKTFPRPRLEGQA